MIGRNRLGCVTVGCVSRGARLGDLAPERLYLALELHDLGPAVVLRFRSRRRRLPAHVHFEVWSAPVLFRQQEGVHRATDGDEVEIGCRAFLGRFDMCNILGRTDNPVVLVTADDIEDVVTFR